MQKITPYKITKTVKVRFQNPMGEWTNSCLMSADSYENFLTEWGYVKQYDTKNPRVVCGWKDKFNFWAYVQESPVCVWTMEKDREGNERW